MRRATTFILILFLLLALAFALGALLTGGEGPSREYQAKMEALHLKAAAKMQAVKVGLWSGLTIIALLGTAGIAAGLARAAWQRSRLIHPHANGIFPVVQGRAGGQTYYHDPNRQVAGSVAYGTGPEGATARPLAPPDDQGQQLQVTSQAQAAQVVAAASQGQDLSDQSRRLVERLARPATARPGPRLPEITVLDKNIPEERLLLAALRADWQE